MQKDKLRNFFKTRREKVKILETAVKNLQDQLDSANQHIDFLNARMEATAQRYKRDMAVAQENAEREEWDRDDERRRRQSALDDLDKAVQYGDAYAISRAQERLRYKL